MSISIGVSIGGLVVRVKVRLALLHLGLRFEIKIKIKISCESQDSEGRLGCRLDRFSRNVITR